MSIGTTFIPLNVPLVTPPVPVWRLSVEQYHEMLRTGILTADHPIELLEGWLVPKMPKNPPHRVASRLIRKALEMIVPPGWYVDAQEPITLATSEPEPDVLVRGDTRDYLDRHPGAADLAMLVEVAEATLSRDRGFKKRTYASALIPVYWIANLIDRQIEVYSHPVSAGDQSDYADRQDYLPRDSVPVMIDGVEVGRLAVKDLLP